MQRRMKLVPANSTCRALGITMSIRRFSLILSWRFGQYKDCYIRALLKVVFKSIRYILARYEKGKYVQICFNIQNIVWNLGL